MQEVHFDLFVKLYLIGKQIQCIIKTHNRDKMSEALILMLLSQKRLGVSEIASTTGIKISAMSTHINKMEKSGLLKRTKGKDLRKNVAIITTKGAATLTQFKSDMHAKYKSRKSIISAADARQIIKLLDKLKLEESC
jgi:DNA-binding MarR family transcriptional regulator